MQCDFCNNDASMEIVMVVADETHRVSMCGSCYQEQMKKMTELFQGQLNPQELQEQMQRALIEFIEHDKGRHDADLEKERHAQALEELREYVKKLLPLDDEDEENAVEEDDELRVNAKEVDDPIFAHIRKNMAIRRRLVKKMEKALAREDYEQCAELRDNIREVSNEIVEWNEKRKATNGV